jgi:hypothetical protein
MHISFSPSFFAWSVCCARATGSSAIPAAINVIDANAAQKREFVFV